MKWIKKFSNSIEQLSFLFLANLGASAVRSLVPIYLTRLLTPELFGLQVVSINLVSLFKEIFEVRICEVTQRFLVQCRTKKDWVGFRQGMWISFQWDILYSIALFSLILAAIFFTSIFYHPE